MLAHTLSAAIGFSHWFGPTLGSPDGVDTPVVEVGVEPGVDFLEVRARFTPALASASAVDGFGGVGLLLRHGLSSGRQEVGVRGGPEVFGVATSEGMRPGVGAMVGAEILISVGQGASRPRIGGFFAAHELTYTLPGEVDADLLGDAHRDAQIDLGFEVVLF